jgi:hypothetical protein
MLLAVKLSMLLNNKNCFYRPKKKWKPPKREKKAESGQKRPRLDLHEPELLVSKEQISMDEDFALQLLRRK